MSESYRIVRFHKEEGREIIKTDLTLQEAKDWCQDPKTSGPGWFDGYEKE